jgi:hypothetical protein
MAEADSNEGENPTSITPEMFIRVRRNEGTPQERELILKALKDPHSELHDWLHGVEEWAERALGGRSSSTRAADQMIEDAVLRQHRDDVVTFLRRKHAEGKISDELLPKILAAGAPRPGPDGLPLNGHAQATADMIQVAALLCPELHDEIAQLSGTRGPDPQDQRR